MKKIFFILLFVFNYANGISHFFKWFTKQPIPTDKSQKIKQINDEYHKKFHKIRSAASVISVIIEKPTYAIQVKDCPLAHQTVSPRAKTAIETLAELGNHMPGLYSEQELKQYVFVEPVANYKTYLDILAEKMKTLCSENIQHKSCYYAVQQYKTILDHVQKNPTPQHDKLSEPEITLLNKTWRWAEEFNEKTDPSKS